MSLYSELYTIIENEMYSRENCNEEQRQCAQVSSDANRATKQAIGSILEAIEDNFSG